MFNNAEGLLVFSNRSKFRYLLIVNHIITGVAFYDAIFTLGILVKPHVKVVSDKSGWLVSCCKLPEQFRCFQALAFYIGSRQI